MENRNEDLYLALLSLLSVSECEDFLGDLLTTKELSDLSDRLAVARLLSRGVYYNEIAERTGASTATISRVSKCLAGERGGYRRVLARLEQMNGGAEQLPAFTLAVPSTDRWLGVYRATLGRLPFLPAVSDRARGVIHGRDGIRILLVDPSDLGFYLDGGTADLCLTSEWELIESGKEDLDRITLDMGCELCLTGSGTPSTVATPYPATVRKYLGDSVNIIKASDPASAVKYASVPASCDLAPLGTEGSLGRLSYVLAIGKSCPDGVRELFEQALE
jgi:TrpR-related protein YerC/YecD